jgi:hypothetical protein
LDKDKTVTLVLTALQRALILKLDKDERLSDHAGPMYAGFKPGKFLT